jgi:hypothetical protein
LSVHFHGTVADVNVDKGARWIKYPTYLNLSLAIVYTETLLGLLLTVSLWSHNRQLWCRLEEAQEPCFDSVGVYLSKGLCHHNLDD